MPLALPPLIEITVYYDQTVERYPGLESSLDVILAESKKLENGGTRVILAERSSLTLGEEKVVEDIRRIRPQKRGSVVASGGRPLPISGSKKLNLQNTPVLLVRDFSGSSASGHVESKPVLVFPCKVGEKYYSVLDGLSFLKQDAGGSLELPGEMEETLASRLIKDPEELEEGLKLVSSEAPISTGRTDLLFSDIHGRYLLVEVEREATDSAIGQILRLAAGFEKDHKLKPRDVRASIACYRINLNVLAAANRANIEIWKYFDENGPSLVRGFKKLTSNS